MRLPLRLFAALALAALLLGVLGSSASGQTRPPRGRTHVVGTYDGSTLRLFVNGRQAAQQRFAGRVNAGDTPVEIGSFIGGQVWFGTIDEVALYDRPLSPSVIQKHHLLGTRSGGTRYAQEIKRTPGVAAYWRLDDRAPRRAVDSVGRHTGSYREGVVVQEPGLITGSADRAAAFNGGQSDIVVSNARSLSLTKGFTLEAWAAAGADREQTLVAKANSWFLKTNATGKWGVGLFSGSKFPSVYSNEPAAIAPSPVPAATPTQTPPPAPTATQPPLPQPSNSNGPNGFVIALIIVVAIGIGIWLLTRRNSEDEEDLGVEPPPPAAAAEMDEHPVPRPVRPRTARSRADSEDGPSDVTRRKPPPRPPTPRQRRNEES